MPTATRSRDRSAASASSVILGELATPIGPSPLAAQETSTPTKNEAEASLLGVTFVVFVGAIILSGLAMIALALAKLAGWAIAHLLRFAKAQMGGPALSLRVYDPIFLSLEEPDREVESLLGADRDRGVSAARNLKNRRSIGQRGMALADQ